MANSSNKSKQKDPVKTPARETGRWFYPLVIITLGIIAYANSFTCSFHLDDFLHIINNNAIKNISNIGAIFGFAISRAMGFATFAVNYHVHGLNVVGYHIVNVLIHLLSALTVRYFVELLFRTPVLRNHYLASYKKSIALWSALIFLVHPVQTQAVTYIVQRYASLASLFYLVSVSLYIRGRLARNAQRTVFFISAALAGLLGMLTKEIVITLPLALVVIELYFFRSEGKQSDRDKNPKKIQLLYLLPLVVIIPVVLLLSPNISDVFSPKTSIVQPGVSITSTTYLLTQFRVLLTYIRLLFIPVNQNLDYVFPIATSPSLPVIAGLAVFSVLLAMAWKLFRSQPLISFGIVWFLLTLSVESSIIPLEDVINEHRLYLPMAGFCMVFVSTIYLILREKTAAAIFFTTIVLTGTGLTLHRNTVWKNEVTLWSDVLAKAPGNPRAQYALGSHYSRKGNIALAKERYAKALALNPNYTDVYLNLGSSLYQEGDFDGANTLFDKALALNPNYAEAYFNLGNVAYSTGDTETARRYFGRALELKPNYAEAIFNLGNVVLLENNFEQARQYYEHALFINPRYPEVYNNIGSTYLREENYGEARNNFQKAIKLRQDYVEAYFGLGSVSYREQNYEDARVWFGKALAIRPGYAEAQYGMGNTYYREGKLEDARHHYQETLDLAPDYLEAHYNLGSVLYSLGHFQEARMHFKDVLRIDPRNGDAQRNIDRISLEIINNKLETD
ncbi:tetratricopeptide repeat protein [Candidatus Latescibacterota bacterium]